MAENKNATKQPENQCLRVGGQAVIEGVMMKGPEYSALAVRTPDGTIDLSTEKTTSVKDRYPVLRIPVVRGVVVFIESMISAYQYMTRSAELSGEEDAATEPSKFELWLAKVTGDDIMNVIMVVAMFAAVIISVGLFVLAPILIVKGLEFSIAPLGIWKGLVEGLARIVIFLLYMYLVSKVKEIGRVFEYHGAEHKSIFCYESGEELTPENARKFSRFHPRCGTSFMFLMMIISIIVFSFVTWDSIVVRMLLKIVLVPVVIGVGYEVLSFTGRHQNAFTKAIAWPGIRLQRLTTKEPDDKQLEVAIAALKAVLPECRTVAETAESVSSAPSPAAEIIHGEETPGEGVPSEKSSGERSPSEREEPVEPVGSDWTASEQTLPEDPSPNRTLPGLSSPGNAAIP
jgi:uncharacterized protein YqhQ